VKYLILLQFVLSAGLAFGQCQAPGQGFLEAKLKEIFHVGLGEAELKEWVSHPKNMELREDVKSLDRRSKFSGRLARQELDRQKQDKFDLMILNNDRSTEVKDFPADGTQSKMLSSSGSIDIEMSNLTKEGLDFFSPEILNKLSPKVKIKYFYPYDKFEYLVTFDNRELPIAKALGSMQQEMEKACELRIFENKEYREWYEKGKNGRGSSLAQ
jgi:hypothetical protein